MSRTITPSFVPPASAEAAGSNVEAALPQIRRKGKRPWWVRGRAVIGLTVLLPFAVAAVLLPPCAERGSPGAIAWDSVGWVLLLAGTAVRFWATLYLGGHKGHCLISEGPYSVCRNPLYLGTFLITLSIAAFVQSPVFALGITLALLAYLPPTVAFEESQLRERLGPDYVEYCRRVPRFWPRWSGFRSRPTIDLDLHALRIECIRAARWAAIPIIAQLVSYLRAVG